ncbi:hypothetical protein SRABI118_00387 [Massilia sp. Bi118]|uniref:outer membrane beta-barrel protein n=1 Tax=Massilia sp. Bi118 TaxID=2822346 RepID=UPI001DCF006B|nr:outer membrane beta-barrel protein [Massilia sp. Bi118]CAH0145232.1 hypothetical protein SRABI118_00387 [Massilia sp. Bi118]
MNAFRFGLAAALLAAGSARAQLVDPASQARLQARPSPEARAFAKMPTPFERTYMVDEGAHPFTKLFDGYRSDPRLVAGINLNRYLALEAGYVERKDRGFHAIDPRDPLDTTGALGTKGFHSYVALKVAAPITDDLSAYGKVGLSHSERRGADALGRQNNVVGGAYTGIGAQYRLNEKASVSVESQKFGNTAEKWGNDTNGNKVNAKLNLGF